MEGWKERREEREWRKKNDREFEEDNEGQA